jgi:hypothetical protein
MLPICASGAARVLITDYFCQWRYIKKCWRIFILVTNKSLMATSKNYLIKQKNLILYVTLTLPHENPLVRSALSKLINFNSLLTVNTFFLLTVTVISSSNLKTK